MLMRTLVRAMLCGGMIAGLAACDSPSRPTNAATAISEVSARSNRFPSYPEAGRTYLSFSAAHGYQVNYIGYGGKAWLWYPGNRVAVPEEWKLDTVAGQRAVCWRHPSRSYNPVTRRKGGGFACSPLALAQKTVVASLPGDPFNLKSGAVPYRLDRCVAPGGFDFDRQKYGC